MTDPIPNSAASEAPQDRDALARFLLPEAGVRGVRVHLDDAWAQIRARASDVPASAVELLGEAAAASALFTGHAKVDGRLSVQLRGTGALRTLFAECTAAGTLRGIAQVAEGGEPARDLRAMGEGAVLAITIATEGAVRAVPPLYVRAARTMGARRLRLYARVILPASLPGITTGLKLGWTFAWRSLMAGELLYVAGRLGQMLTLGRELNDLARVMAVMVVIVVLGLGFERLLFGALERRVRERWGYDTPS